MKYLDTIKKAADQCFEVDIAKKTREEIYVIGRAAYYVAAKKKTKYSLRIIGLMVGRDHASVLHGIKMYKCYCRDFPEFLPYINAFEQEMIKAFDVYKKIDVKKLTHDEIEIEVLKNKLKKEQNKNQVLKHNYHKIKSHIPTEIVEALETLTDIEMEELIKYKITPHMKMIASQRSRITA